MRSVFMPVPDSFVILFMIISQMIIYENKMIINDDYLH